MKKIILTYRVINSKIDIYSINAMRFNTDSMTKGENYVKSIVCDKCGSSELTEKNGYLVCDYCGSKFILTKEETKISKCQSSSKGNKNTEININEDIKRLIRKCEYDKPNAKRYAKLILDIDPDNAEARKYI